MIWVQFAATALITSWPACASLVMTKRFVVAWYTGAIAAVYVVAVALSYLLTR